MAKVFDPKAVGLSEGFVLTDYTGLKGCGCKIPQERLLDLLRNLGELPGERKNVGMDCSIVPLKKLPDAFLISTIDYFFPLVEDPYQQGRIGCANVLSDMYSMGIDEVDTMLMVLAASKDMTPEDRWITTRELMKGFNDLAAEAETEVTGGQSVICPWPIIGGVAMAVCHKDDFVRPTGLQVGDYMVLTKPLGTQVAVNLKQQFNKKDEAQALYAKAKGLISEEDVVAAFHMAAESMSHLSRVGARLMRKHACHGATDITGFGIMGHSSNLAVAQPVPLQIQIHTLPIIKNMEVDGELDFFRLLHGFSAETSGGLFAAFPTEEVAKAFIRDLALEDNTQAWIVGRVAERPEADSVNSAVIVADRKLISVDHFYLRTDEVEAARAGL